MALLKISGKRFFELRRNSKRLQESYRIFIESLTKLYNKEYIVLDYKTMNITKHYNKSKEEEIIKEIEEIIHQYILGTKDTMCCYKDYYYDDVKEVEIEHYEFESLIDRLNMYETKVLSMKSITVIADRIKFALKELEEYFDNL